MTKANQSACPVYTKVFNALADTPQEIRHYSADSICKQAARLGIKNTSKLSAREIVAAIQIKQSQIQDKQIPPSKEESPNGVSDKYPPPSTLETKSKYIKRLMALGLSAQEASDAADLIYGQMNKAISGKTAERVAARLKKQYPNLSQASIDEIVRQSILETKGATHIRVASAEVPAWAACNTDIYGDKLPDLLPSESRLKGAALDKHVEYMTSIHENISDVMRERALARFENRKQRAAALRQKEDAESKVPKWARALGW